ncbi:hypothetical protein BDFB_011318 [Asbolus verrucosus]|nr:hypothetical protein BDFB_011318 [Asbolus verrucosus]
MSLTNCK